MRDLCEVETVALQLFECPHKSLGGLRQRPFCGPPTRQCVGRLKDQNLLSGAPLPQTLGDLLPGLG
jgi:hypothetical protein